MEFAAPPVLLCVQPESQGGAQRRLYQPVVDQAARQALHHDQARFSGLAVALVSAMGAPWFQVQYCWGHADERDELLPD